MSDPSPSAPAMETATMSLAEALQLGVQLQRAGRFTEATAIYQVILGAAPEHPDALHYLGLIACQQGRPEEALDLLRRAIAADPGHADARNNLGNLLLQSGRHAEAADAFRQAIVLAPGRPEAHNNLALALKAQGDWAGAEAVLEQAVALDPARAEACYNLGNLRRQRGQLEPAIVAYRMAIERSPDIPEYHYNLGLALAASGQPDAAAAAYQKTLALESHHADAHFELAACRANAGLLADAVEGFRRGLELNPQAFHAYQLLGNVLNVLGRTEEAADLWRQWLAVEPDNPIPRHMLAAATGRGVPGRAADDYVRQVFDSFARQFDERLKELDYRAPELLVEAVAHVLGPPRGALDILDAGCGTGWCGPLLRAHGRRLVGVDLSQGMIDRARERGTYDELHVAELTAFMAGACTGAGAGFDLIVSADTLVYFGDLRPPIAAARAALRDGGLLAFTVEQLDDTALEPDFRLHSKGRYSHRESYLRRVLADEGMTPLEVTPVELRREALQPVAGWVVVARSGRPPAATA